MFEREKEREKRRPLISVSFGLFFPSLGDDEMNEHSSNSSSSSRSQSKVRCCKREERKIASERAKKSFEQNENFLDESDVKLLPFFVLLKM